jgi:hypothetical protein
VKSSWLNGTATFFSPIPRKPPTPMTTATDWPLRSISTSLTSPIDSLLALTTVVPISREASHWPGCCCVTKLPLAAPEVDDIVDPLEVEPAEPLAVPDGIAEPPEVLVEPEVMGEPAEPLAPGARSAADVEEPEVVLAPEPIEAPDSRRAASRRAGCRRA